MGAIDKTRAALVKHFVDSWPTSGHPEKLGVTRVELPNQKFDRGTNKPWGRLSVRFAGRENAAIGATKIRTTGILYFQFFTPEGTGTKILTDAGDALASIFDNRTLSHITGTGKVVCRAVNIFETGSRDGYEQMTYGIDFYSDDNR
jgi:hypothetical protein